MKSVVLIFSLVLFFASCKEAEPIPNRPPSSFEVNTTLLENNGKGMVLKLVWNESKDPDNDLINYSIVINSDTVATNLSSTNYTAEVGYNLNISGSVIAKDGKGLSTKVNFAVQTTDNPFVVIPDSKFEVILIRLNLDSDRTRNNRISKSDAEKITSLRIYREGLTSLSGIEYFKNLRYLDCSDNVLKNIDVSKNINLEYLNCTSTEITDLNIDNNVNLVEVVCYFNRLLTELNTAKNINLQKLYCGGNRLRSLNLTENVKLVELECPSNELTALDLTSNVALEKLSFNNNKINRVDLNNNIALKEIDCRQNSIVSLDITKNVAIESFSCALNSLSNIDLSQNTKLKNLDCASNEITELDLSKNTDLEQLNCFNNKLTSLDLRNNKRLYLLDCSANNIKTICLHSTIQISGTWRKDSDAEYRECK